MGCLAIFELFFHFIHKSDQNVILLIQDPQKGVNTHCVKVLQTMIQADKLLKSFILKSQKLHSLSYTITVY